MFLTMSQKKYFEYLDPLKAKRRVMIHRYRNEISQIAKKIIKKIHSAIPRADVRFIGASALKISGQNDIDIWVLVSPPNRTAYISKLKSVFGDPVKKGRKWKWEERGYEVAVNVVNPENRIRKKELKIFEILKNNPGTLKAYERLKTSLNGKTYKEYQTRKMWFLNEILDADIENRKNLEYLVKIGAATMNSHVVTPYGRHATGSFTKYKLFRYPRSVIFIAKKIAEKFKDERIRAVIGMASGGSILSILVAWQLERILNVPVLSFYGEQDAQGKFILRDKSNEGLIKNTRALVVDDTLNTGKTARKFISFVRSCGAHVVGLGAIYQRNPISPESLNIPKLYTFARSSDLKDSYIAKKCPLCRKGIPVDKNFGVGG